MSAYTTPGQLGRILLKESLEAAASAVSVSNPASTKFLMSSTLIFTPGHLSCKTWQRELHSAILLRQANKRKPVARKTTKKWENEIKP
jgi:hypothetical protein